ncbi:MAG TPA: hypothetical protein VIW24_19010 [Aldersonia sp.]
MWDSLWDMVWCSLVIVAFVAYLMLLVWILSYLFGERGLSAQPRTRMQTDGYIRSVAGTSAADRIADAEALLDSGAIGAGVRGPRRGRGARLSRFA